MHTTRFAAMAVALLLAGCATAPGRLPVARDGRTDYVIVTGKNASPSTQYAAEELQRHLKEMTGATIPIQTDDAPMAAREIILGRNAHLEALITSSSAGRGLAQSLDGLGDEGYVIRTVDKHLVIAGGDLRGAMYGVYGLLEDHLGCRWFTPDVSRIPKRSRLTLPAINDRKVPVLEYREPFVMDCYDGDWCARNRMNSSAARLEEKHGGKVRFGQGLFVHTFNVLMPPEKYFDEHPEYYSLVGGKRIKDQTQLCCTNEDVVRIVTEELLSRIRQDPGAFVYSLSQNDWANYCECANCTALAEAEESQMGPVLYLVNRAAEAVEKEFPDKAIETLAYQYTRKPPKTMRPRPNVIIRLCSIECDFMQPLATSDFEANREFVRDLEGWAHVAPRLWVWDYVTSFRSYLCPFPNLRVRDDNIRLFVKNNVRGIFEQDVYNTLSGELSPLSGYLGAKLLWDPNYDEDTAINEFLEGVYGNAAKPIRAYIDLIHDKVEKENIHAGIWIAPRDAPFITDELLTKASALWDKAEAAVAHEPETLARVRVARLSVDYAILDRQNNAGIGGHRVDHAHFRAEIDPAYAARVQRFFETARAGGVTRIDEGRTSLDQYEEFYRNALKGGSVTYTPLEPVAAKTAPGLTYAYYEGAFERLPDFTALTPTAAGVSETINLTMRRQDDYYALLFEGYIDAPRDGLYTFYIASNDGSRLYIGKQLLIDNDGLHGLESRGGFAALKKGLHPIRIEYFQAGMRYGLETHWSGPGFEKEEIPAKALRHTAAP